VARCVDGDACVGCTNEIARGRPSWMEGRG